MILENKGGIAYYSKYIQQLGTFQTKASRYDMFVFTFCFPIIENPWLKAGKVVYKKNVLSIHRI